MPDDHTPQPPPDEPDADADAEPEADAPSARTPPTTAAIRTAPDAAAEAGAARTVQNLDRAIRWSAAILLTAGVAALLLLVLWSVRIAVIPILVALLITALVVPFDRLLRRIGLNLGWSAGLSATALVLVVAAVVWVVVWLLVDAAGEISRSLRAAVDEVSDDRGPLGDAVRGASDSLTSLGEGVAQEAAGGVLAGLSLAGQLVAGTVLTLALVFFLLRDRARLVSLLRTGTPGGQGELALRMARRAWRAMAGYMRGTTIIAAIDALFITVGLALLGVPQAPGLGALVFVGAYIPYVGAFLSGTVAVLVAFAQQGIWTAVAALGVVLLVQFVEGTFLQPIVQSRTVALHPAVVMLAVTAGATLGGLLGTLLAVPLTAAALGILTELRATFASAPDAR